MIRNNATIKKAVSKNHWGEINILQNKIKQSVCDEIIDFGKNEGFTDFILVERYKLLLDDYIKNLEFVLSNLQTILDYINNDTSLIDSKEFTVNDKLIKVVKSEMNIEIIYLDGYDDYTKLYRYGYMSVNGYERGTRAINLEVLFSSIDNLLDFDLKKHISEHVSILANSNTLEEIQQIRLILDQELFTHFHVKNYRELFDKENGLLSEEDKLQLIRELSISIKRSDVKISILQKGVTDFNDRLIDLILEKKKCNNYLVEKDWYIEEFGSTKYNKLVDDSIQKINIFTSELSISEIELAQSIQDND